MSRQSKLRNKQRARKVARADGRTGHVGVGGMPHKQTAPPWVRNGSRQPKAVRERAIKLQAERDAVAREAQKQRQRETADEE